VEASSRAFSISSKKRFPQKRFDTLVTFFLFLYVFFSPRLDAEKTPPVSEVEVLVH